MNAQDAFKQVHSLSKNKQAFAKTTVEKITLQSHAASPCTIATTAKNGQHSVTTKKKWKGREDFKSR